MENLTPKTTPIVDSDKKLVEDIENKKQQGEIVINTQYPLLNYATPLQWEEEMRTSWLNQEPPELTYLTTDIYVQMLGFAKSNIRKFLGKVAGGEVKFTVHAFNSIDGFSSDVLARTGKALLEAALRDSRDSYDFYLSVMEAAIAGTCFEYHGFEVDLQENEHVEYTNPLTMEQQTTKKTTLRSYRPKSTIIGFENFLFPSPFYPIQEQPWVIWKTTLPFEVFKHNFRKFKNVGNVRPGGTTDEGDPFYAKILSSVNQDEVEILRYYSRIDNTHCIVANGVILFKGVNPFKHGLYPFTRKVFSEFGGKFFMYGDAFPNLIKGENSLINYLWTLMSHQQKWASTPMVISADPSFSLDEGPIEAMQVLKEMSQGDLRVEKTPDVGGGAMGMIGKLQEFIREFSGNLGGGGDLFTPQGGQVAVTQILMANEESLKAIGFNMFFIKSGEQEKKLQQFSNVRQFYTLPQMHLMTGQTMTDVYSFKYPLIRVEDQEIRDQEQGTMLIQMYEESDPTLDINKIKERVQILQEVESLNGKKAKSIAIDPKEFDLVKWSVFVDDVLTQARNVSLEVTDRMETFNFFKEQVMTGVLDDVDLKRMAWWTHEPKGLDKNKFKTSKNPLDSMQTALTGPGNQTPGGSGSTSEIMGSGARASQQFQKNASVTK